MQLKEITDHLETIAPPAYQEDYDNAGLIVGNMEEKTDAALICLDSTEAVIDEARSEEHTSELQSHSFISYAVFCLKKKTIT